MRKLKIKYALALSLAGVCALGTTSGLKATSRGVAPKEKFTYVSLGDSMSTGFGFDDYYLGKYESTMNEKRNLGLIAEEDGFRNVRGFLNNETKESYPALVRDYLKTKHRDKDVDWIQLATNAARVDDLYFQLAGEEGDAFYKYSFSATGGHEKWNKAFAYRAYELGYEPAVTEFEAKSNNYATIDYNNIVNKIYVDSVKKADLITLNAGFNNFGCFVSGRINKIIKNLPEELSYSFGGDDKLQDLLDTIGVDIDTEVIYKEIFDLLKSSIPFEMSDEGVINLGLEIDLKYFIDRVAYATVSYCYYMNELTKLIRKYNPTAELVVVGMEGAIKGITMKIGDFTIDIEDFYNKLFKYANLFAAVGTEVADTYKFVDLANVEVGLHVTDMAAGTMDETQVNRAMMAIQSLCSEFGLGSIVPEFDSVLGMINDGVNAFLDTHEDLALPIAYAKANCGLQPFDIKKYMPTGMTAAQAYMQKWPLNLDTVGKNELVDAIAEDYGVIDSIVEPGTALVLANGIITHELFVNGLTEYYTGLYTFLSIFQRAVGSAEITPEALSAFGGGDMTETFMGGALDGLLNLYIRAILNNGMWNHPNAEGHRAISEAVIAGIESNVTAREYGLAQVYALLEELTGLPVQQIVETLMAKKEEAVVLFEKTGELFSLYSGEILDVIKSAIEKVAPVVVEEAKGLADFSFARLSELKDSVMAKLAEGVDLAKVKVNEAVEEIKEVIAREVAGLKAILELTVKAMEITLKAQAKKAIEFGEAKLAETYNAVAIKLVEIRDNFIETSEAIADAAVRALKAAQEDIMEYVRGLIHCAKEDYEELKAKLISDIKADFEQFVKEAKAYGEELYVKLNNAAAEFAERVKQSAKAIVENGIEFTEEIGREILSMHVNLVNVAKALESFVAGAQAYFAELYNGGLEQLHATIDKIVSEIEGGVNYCAGKANEALEFAESTRAMVEEYVAKINEAAMAKYADALEKAEAIKSIAETFVAKVQTLFVEAKATIEEINAAVEVIKSKINEMTEEAAVEALKVVDSLIVARDAIKEAIDNAKEVVAEVRKALEDATELIAEAVSKVTSAVEKAMAIAEQAVAKLTAVFNEVKGTVIAVAIATSAAITTVVTVIEFVNGKVGEKVAAVAAVLKSVVNKIVNFAEATCEFLVETTEKIVKFTGEAIDFVNKVLKAYAELKVMIGKAIDITKAVIDYVSIQAEKIMAKVNEAVEVLKLVYNKIDEVFPGLLASIADNVKEAVEKEININVEFLKEEVATLRDESVEKVNAELVAIDEKFVALEGRLEEMVAEALAEALDILTDGAIKVSVKTGETALKVTYLVTVAAVESAMDINEAVIEGIVEVFNTTIKELTTAPEINFVMNHADIVEAKEELHETVESSIEEIIEADENAHNSIADAFHRLLQSMNLAD